MLYCQIKNKNLQVSQAKEETQGNQLLLLSIDTSHDKFSNLFSQVNKPTYS